MTETTEKVSVEVKSAPRPPVKWQIAAVNDEKRSVTVIFPLSSTVENTNSEEKERG
jgi:hypothetical protein